MRIGDLNCIIKLICIQMQQKKPMKEPFFLNTVWMDPNLIICGLSDSSHCRKDWRTQEKNHAKTDEDVGFDESALVAES